MIFIILLCGHPLGSPGLCWAVASSIACPALVEIFQGLAGAQGIFFEGVKRIGLGEMHFSKVEVTLGSLGLENDASLNLPVLHLGAALCWRWFAIEAGRDAQRLSKVFCDQSCVRWGLDRLEVLLGLDCSSSTWQFSCSCDSTRYTGWLVKRLIYGPYINLNSRDWVLLTETRSPRWIAGRFLHFLPGC